MTPEQARSELARRELARRQQPEQQNGVSNMSDLAMGIGGIAGASAVGYGAKQAWDLMAPFRTKAAGHFVNQLIKPKHKEYMFGKNPGQGVAKEGLFANSIEELGSKVDERLGQLNTYAKGIRSLEENKFKTADFSNAFDPFIKALDELGKAPETHGAKINEIYRMVKDLEGNIPKGVKLNEVPVDVAYQIKDVVKNMQKWTVDNPSDHITNKALKGVYGNIDKSIDKVLPLAEVNSRMANLISAKSAIKNQIELLSKRDPFEYRGIVNLATTPLRSTAVKTGLAKILAEKFGFIPKVAKRVSKGGAGFLSGYPTISQALQFAIDPEAAQVSMVGGELAPMGSEEREIQLGRLA